MIFGLDSEGDKTEFASSSRPFTRGGVRLDYNCAWALNTQATLT
jgi:hypothetical protein